MASTILEGIDYKNRPVCVFGGGMIARAMLIALKALPEYPDMNLVGCMVTYANKNVSEVEGYQVYSIDDLVERYPDVEVILAVREMYLDDVKAELEKRGVTSYHFISLDEALASLDSAWRIDAGERADSFAMSLERCDLTTEDKVMFYSKQLKKDQLNFEVNLANHCNLNCQCCNHFSPLAEEGYLDIEGYKRDLSRIHELFGDSIGRVMLLGGEPLLNRDIVEILKLTRHALPQATLYIFTNGLLLGQMTDDFWDTCRDERIGIKVTKYPINVDYDHWQRYAADRGVDLTDENPEPIKTTYRLPFIEEGGLDPYDNYVKCYHANQCIVLRDGRLYTCPIAGWIDQLNQHFNKNFPALEEVSIDIHAASSRDEIDAFLKRPNAMCSHCDIYHYEYNIPWARTKMDVREWVER